EIGQVDRRPYRPRNDRADQVIVPELARGPFRALRVAGEHHALERRQRGERFRDEAESDGMDVRHVLAATLRVRVLPDLDPEPAPGHLGLVGWHVLDLGQGDVKEDGGTGLVQLERDERFSWPGDSGEPLLE